MVNLIITISSPLILQWLKLDRPSLNKKIQPIRRVATCYFTKWLGNGGRTLASSCQGQGFEFSRRIWHWVRENGEKGKIVLWHFQESNIYLSLHFIHHSKAEANPPFKIFIYKQPSLIVNLTWPLRGARYLAGENLKVVWAEFSTFS